MFSTFIFVKHIYDIFWLIIRPGYYSLLLLMYLCRFWVTLFILTSIFSFCVRVGLTKFSSAINLGSSPQFDALFLLLAPFLLYFLCLGLFWLLCFKFLITHQVYILFLWFLSHLIDFLGLLFFSLPKGIELFIVNPDLPDRNTILFPRVTSEIFHRLWAILMLLLLSCYRCF